MSVYSFENRYIIVQLLLCNYAVNNLINDISFNKYVPLGFCDLIGIYFYW